jgi:hypothetical protein
VVYHEDGSVRCYDRVSAPMIKHKLLEDSSRGIAGLALAALRNRAAPTCGRPSWSWHEFAA